MDLKPILHYALGLRFVNVCEQKRETNVRKIKNANETTHSVIRPLLNMGGKILHRPPE